jgi:phosphoglycolate phosphatase
MQPAAIFDLDGTLVDSRAVIAEAMDRAFASVGLPKPGYQRTRAMVGMSLRAGIAYIAPGHDDPTIDALTDAYRQSFMAIRAERPPRWTEPLYAGALTLVDRLRAEGWKIGMATGKSVRGIDHILDGHGIRDRFAAIACSDHGPGKPDPFMVHRNLELLGAEPAHAVVIGDTTHDILMARAAGVAVVGVTWGFHTHDEIAGAAPSHITADFAGLSAWLDGFAAKLKGREGTP